MRILVWARSCGPTTPNQRHRVITGEGGRDGQERATAPTTPNQRHRVITDRSQTTGARRAQTPTTPNQRHRVITIRPWQHCGLARLLQLPTKDVEPITRSVAKHGANAVSYNSQPKTSSRSPQLPLGVTQRHLVGLQLPTKDVEPITMPPGRSRPQPDPPTTPNQRRRADHYLQ